MPTRPPIHRPTGYTPPTATRKAYDKARAHQHSKDYDRAWQRLRKSHLAEHPLCVMCQANGIILAAEVVDHIEPIAKNPERRLDPSNLRSMCKYHHDQRTAQDTWHTT